MAQFELPTKLWVNKRAFPYWIDQALDSNVPRSSAHADMLSMSPKGIIVSQPNHNSWLYIPILKDLPVDNFEVLLKIYRVGVGTNAWVNGGFGLMFWQAEAASNENRCYICVGSGSSHKNIFIRRYDTLDTSSDLLSTTVSNLAAAGGTYFLRIRREGIQIKVRAWPDATEEPAVWNADVTDDINKYSHVLFKSGFDSQASDIITEFAYATDGDTAQFNPSVPKKTIAHQRSGATASDYSLIKDSHTHDVLAIVRYNASGTWVTSIPLQWNFYIVDELLSGTFYDYRFAYGDGYLGGDYPEGIVTVGGIPAEAEIDVRFRMPDDPVLDGKIVRQGVANSAGIWLIPNLAENLKYDVVARREGEKDMLAPNISASPDTVLLPYHTGGWGLTPLRNTFVLRCAAERMAPPLSVSFTGIRIPKDIANTVTLVDNVIQIERSMHDHGRFEFEVNVQDSLSKQFSIPVLLEDVSRTAFVDVIGTVTSVATANASSKAITLPATTVVNDLIIIAITHRNNSLTITDDSGQTWQRVSCWSDYYPQGSTFYYRKAVVGDASRSVTLKLAVSAMLLIHCVILRGKFLPLEVKQTISHSSRYDSSYSESIKKLTPVEHQSGFLMRSVGNVYALSDAAKAKMILSDMNMIGVKAGAPYRMQTGYIHLSKPGVFNCTYETAASNTEDTIPDVVLIIDEVRE